MRYIDGCMMLNGELGGWGLFEPLSVWQKDQYLLLYEIY